MEAGAEFLAEAFEGWAISPLLAAEQKAKLFERPAGVHPQRQHRQPPAEHIVTGVLVLQRLPEVVDAGLMQQDALVTAIDDGHGVPFISDFGFAIAAVIPGSPSVIPAEAGIQHRGSVLRTQGHRTTSAGFPPAQGMTAGDVSVRANAESGKHEL